MQILCDKVTGVVFCWCPWYAGLGTPAVAALGTKPAPTLAKSVLLLLALLFNDAACSIQNNGLSVVGLLLYIYLVWERNLDLLNFQCINNLLPTVLHCESLVVTSHYLWWHWPGRLTFVTSWHGECDHWPAIITPGCPGGFSHWNAILQNWYKAQNNTIVFLQESSFKIASRYFQPTSSHP